MDETKSGHLLPVRLGRDLSGPPTMNQLMCSPEPVAMLGLCDEQKEHVCRGKRVDQRCSES